MIKAIEPEELHQAIEDKTKKVLLLDVRELEEAEISVINDSVLIPLMELEDRVTEVHQLFHQEADEKVVYCRAGSRSELAIQWLQSQQGIKGLKNLNGGINAYAERADKTLTVY